MMKCMTTIYAQMIKFPIMQLQKMNIVNSNQIQLTVESAIKKSMYKKQEYVKSYKQIYMGRI